MLAAYTADWHLSGFGQDKIIENLPLRLYEKQKALYHMADYCTSNNIKNMIIAGDLLHNKSIIYNTAINILLEFFRKYNNLHFYSIDGNHDLSGRGDVVVSALSCLKNESNVTWIPFDSQLQVENIFMVPYSSDIVSKIKNGRSDYLCSHLGLDEGILASGLSLKSDISLKDLIGRYKKVILGHYHTVQQIVRDDIEVWYTGSLTQDTWNDRDEKRFLIIDSEKHTIQSIPTEGYTKHYQFNITNENKTEIFNEATKLKAEGHNVKIVKNGIIDTTNFSDEFIIVDKTEIDITNRGINSSMSASEKLEKFMNIKKIPENELEEYKKMALEIISSC